MADVDFASKRIRTHNVESVTDHFKFPIGAAGAVGTLSQGNGAGVTSVTSGGTGVGTYTIQLAKPYPASMLDCKVNISAVAVTSLLQRAVYKASSYSATAGTFIILTSAPTDDTHATTQIAADLVSGTEIMVSYTYLEL